ncbi:MAG: hypothetical protein U9Q70_12690 [Chloroflexota bacterium]|nr:hypothetical protein [Chloroflexota bacterium]
MPWRANGLGFTGAVTAGKLPSREDSLKARVAFNPRNFSRQANEKANKRGLAPFAGLHLVVLVVYGQALAC